MKRWPGIFDLPAPDSTDEDFLTIFTPALKFYFIWVFVYLLYNYFMGRHYGMPDSKLDSQTMYTFRTNKFAAKVCGWKPDTYETRHAFKPILIHMFVHAIMTTLVIAFSYVMYHNMVVHSCWCFFILCSAAWNGAMRYYNMMTKYFIKSL